MAECSDSGLPGPSLLSHKEKGEWSGRKLELSWIPKTVIFRIHGSNLGFLYCRQVISVGIELNCQDTQLVQRTGEFLGMKAPPLWYQKYD